MSTKRGDRTSKSMRKEKVLTLLNRLPGRFTIKEISDIYDSWESQNLNRNSLRNTLNDLLDDDLISCTIPKKRTKELKEQAKGHGGRGHGSYYGISSNDLFRRISISFNQLNYLDDKIKNHIAKSIGRSLVSESIETISTEIKTGQCYHESPEDIRNHIKFSYPFIDFSYTNNDRSIATSTVIQAELPEMTEEEMSICIIDGKYKSNNQIRTFNIFISDCLCKGDPHYSKACQMVSGALEKSVIADCGFTAKSEYLSSTANGCNFLLTLMKTNGKTTKTYSNTLYSVDESDTVEAQKALSFLNNT